MSKKVTNASRMISRALKGVRRASHQSFFGHRYFHALERPCTATLPRIHAKYGEFEITEEIDSGIVAGKFPPRALKHVVEWYGLHKEELAQDWELCRQAQQPRPIEPLE